MTSNLDMLTDKPLELAIALLRLAKVNSINRQMNSINRQDWWTFAAAMEKLVADLKALDSA